MKARLASVALALTALASAALALGMADERRFPHDEHAGLFPTCTGCHAGVVSGAEADLYPPASSCAGCHDGQDVARVEWSGPQRDPSNLRFSHVAHNDTADLGDPALNCRECHGRADTTLWMAVQDAQPEQCIACHAHRATAHLADDAPCRECHVTLVQAVALSDSAITGFPRPPSHDRPDFLTNHEPTVAAATSQCAVCHARESCERCHANGANVQAIAALERDPRVVRLVANVAAEYPVPADHRDPDWSYDHGDDARRRIASCGNCHAQPSCRSCHIGRGAARTIARLPAGSSGGARGVQLRAREPDVSPAPGGGDGDARPGGGGVSAAHAGGVAVAADTARRVAGPRDVQVHPPGFLTEHGPSAAAGQLTCSGCHERKMCADCHDGEGRRRFHIPDFVVRHASDAYGRQRECATCHNTESFCRACHAGSGLRAEGRLDVAFHTGQPLWLLQHGQAARQGLESCTSCHTQRDCMQCHSALGWSVSPHGPGFDGARMAKRNRALCRACHFGDPLEGGG